jgi:hypothetical protein
MATGRITDYSIFGARRTERPSLIEEASAAVNPSASQAVPSRAMHFLVKRESRLIGFWRSLAVLCSRTGPFSFHGPIHFFRNQRLAQFRLRPRSFSASVLLHGSMIALLVYLPRVLPAEQPSDTSLAVLPAPEEFYFRIPLDDTTKPLPKMAPTTAADPAKSVEPPDTAKEDPPKAENTVTYGSLAIVSKPVRPDNSHQTIIQPQSPPDLKIPYDLKIPNIVLALGNKPDIAKPALDIKPSDSKPMQSERQVAALAAPTVASARQNPFLPAADAPQIPRPTAVTSANDAKPQQVQKQVASVAAPTVATSRQTAALPFSAPTDIARPRYVPAANDAKPQGSQRQVAVLPAPSVTPTVQHAILPLAATTDIGRPTYVQSDSNAKPQGGQRQVAAIAAPSIAAQSVTAAQQTSALLSAGPAAIARPTFVPSSGNAKALETQGQQRQMASVQAPSVGGPKLANLPDGIAQGTAGGPRPPMPAPGSSAPQMRRSEGGAQGNQAAVAPTVRSGGDKIDLVAIGTDPADPSSEIKLPPGNRSGEFAISPAGATGSGNPSNDDSKTSAAKALAANGAGMLSITGPRASDDGTGMLDPLAANEVFPVPADLLPKMRANHLVVSTGPMGGGGLNLYGAMQCGRIYTVFLEMPKDSWTLQFCEKKPDGAQPAPQTSSGIIQMEAPIAPPDAQTRFDFQRLPVAPEKAHKLIILKGIIREDGSVDQVQVFQGILPQMDEAARLALSRWKFKPALRDGKAVPLQILVGIPVTATTTP